MDAPKRIETYVGWLSRIAVCILLLGLTGSRASGQHDLPVVVAAPGRPSATVEWMDQLHHLTSRPVTGDDAESSRQANQGEWPKQYPKSRWIVDRPTKQATTGQSTKARHDDSYMKLANAESSPATEPESLSTSQDDQIIVQHEPVVCADDGCRWLTNEHWRPEGISGPWPPDEYLCDGGDANVRVVISREAQVSGLDPEDTVVHYDTAAGRTIVKPTNSVCIYAPRFAAVRQVRGMRADERLLQAQVVDQPLPPLMRELSQPPNILNQPEQPVRLLDIDGAMALRDRIRGLELENGQRVAELRGILNPFEEFQIVRIGINNSTQKARLAEAISSAIVWSEAEAPEVLIDLVEASVDTTYQKAGVVYQLDAGPPCLRVIKLASSKAARPGEIVEFAIRFDNIGDQTVEHVTVIDNLTTRLEYVPDSSRSDREVEFFSDENDGESLTLRWRINEPLQPGDGGIILFKCKVR